MRKGNKQMKGLMSRVQFQQLRYDDVNAVVHGYDIGTREDFSLSPAAFVNRYLEQFSVILGGSEYRTAILQHRHQVYADESLRESYCGNGWGLIGCEWRRYTASKEDAAIVDRTMIYASNGNGAIQTLETTRGNGEIVMGRSLVLPIGNNYLSIIRYEE